MNTKSTTDFPFIRINHSCKTLVLLSAITLLLSSISCTKRIYTGVENLSNKEKTVFQTAQPWKPVTDVRADVAIVYGANDYPNISFIERVNSWREKGYKTHFMTGIAWGEYQDYFTGKWDGKWHLDEGQVTQRGDTIWHGHMVPYIVPTANYLEYIKQAHVKKVIDAGIDAIFFEEPEFWARAGYSESFKREWKAYYGFDWMPQHESPENTYLSNKLKYHLYYRALEDVSRFAKEYGKSKGMNVRCYVPTHSLVNYSQWQIVSPEASLASMPSIDGYIAQVWTGTSREPNFYNGIQKERVFETAFLEYGSMESMTAPTGRKMFFLTDPIEDWPRDWADYKKNYQATFTAQLLYPNIADYEVMPWPDRIYEGLYRTSANSEQKERIPRFYSTQMQVMINALNNMPLSDNKVSGTSGIGVLMANSLMFQRFPVHQGYEDPQLSNFYGQALPLLKRGVPVQTVHIENTSYPFTWKNLKVLVMSYSGMKPLSPEFHTHIANWVKSGGMLVYCGRDNDPFQRVREWWNTDGNHFERASDHLFGLMGLDNFPNEGKYGFGKGSIIVLRKDPKEFVLSSNSDGNLINAIEQLYKEKTGKLPTYKNSLYLERGNYELVSVLEESVSNESFVLKGKLIDLFDPQLPVLNEKTVRPGEQAFLYNIGKIADKKKAQVLAAASRVYDETQTKQAYSFVAKSPKNTSNVMRIYLPFTPTTCTAIDTETNLSEECKWDWDAESKTLRLFFENQPAGVRVTIN